MKVTTYADDNPLIVARERAMCCPEFNELVCVARDTLEWSATSFKHPLIKPYDFSSVSRYSNEKCASA